MGAIVLSRRTSDPWPASAHRILEAAAVEASAALARVYSQREAEARASTDALTGLPNRRYFDEFCGLLARRRRAEDAVGVLMIDIDRFKELNDTYGHAIGDEVLRAVAGAIVGAVREDDVPARFGGEEFVVLLRNPGPDDRGRGRRARPRGRRRARPAPARRPRRVACRSASPWPRQPDQPIDDAHRRGRPGALPREARRPRPGRRRLSRPRPASRRTTARYPAPMDPIEDAPPRDDEDADEPEAPRALTNGDLARIFHEIGDILEVKGELVFKTVAYHRAADAIGRSAGRRRRGLPAGERARSPASARRSATRSRSSRRPGHMAFYDRLRAEIPPSLVELLRIPGLGPKTVRARLGVGRDRDLEDLRRAAEAGTLRTIKGISARTEQLILEGIERLESRPQRLLLHRAQAHQRRPRGAARGRARASAGSCRPARSAAGARRSATSTCSPRPTTRDAVVERFAHARRRRHGRRARATQGRRPLLRGPQVDLMVMPPGEAGTYLIHFTGSKEHNVRLRGIARDRGWSLSEKGFLRIGEDGRPLTGDAAELRTFATEAEAYAFLDLPFIEPELREDEGEIEARSAGRLPALVTRADLRGDLHTHSDWSDGVHSIEVMAEAGRRRGYAYQVLTDHSQSLGDRPRPGPGPRRAGARDHRRAQRPVRGGGGAGTAPGRRDPGGFRLLHGCELEVRADGRLDYEDDLLARFDLVVASVHVARRQPRAELTRRTLNAIRARTSTSSPTRRAG